MKNSIKQKNGISLIVLVITIIVMIILASAIILSLSSSSIIGRANEAKIKSDIANAKEVVSLAYAEWELDNADLKETYSSFSEYATVKLNEAGFDTNSICVTNEGDVLTGTAAFFVANNISIGTTVTGYVLNSTTTYTTSGNENTCELFEGMNYGGEGSPISSTLSRDENIIWSYMGIDEDGNALIVGSVTDNSPTMLVGGFGAYLYGPRELDKACETMYSSNIGKARNINFDDVIRVLEYEGPLGMYYDIADNVIKTQKPLLIGEIAKQLNYNFDEQGFWYFLPDQRKIEEYKSELRSLAKNDSNIKAGDLAKNLIFQQSNYWLSSSFVIAQFAYGATFEVRYVNNTAISSEFMVDTDEGSVQATHAIRPVVILDSDIDATYDGTNVTLSK